MKRQLSQVELKRLLSYDPGTGIFTRLISWTKDYPVGSIAGRVDKDGYLRITVNRIVYSSHRLAWFYFYGVWPKGNIDHIDMNKKNNKISNLREDDLFENARNKDKLITNKSGYKGVAKNTRCNTWRSTITANRKTIYLGSFSNKEDAAIAYDKAAIRLHGEFARTNFPVG